MLLNNELTERIKRLKLIVMDVDGTLTDGGLYYANSGERFKKFYVKDGAGIRLAMKAGLEVAFITGLESQIVSDRAKDLGVKIVVQNCIDKDIAIAGLMEEKGLSWEEIAFIGDDIIDKGAMQKVGIAVAVNDASDEIKELADIITSKPGGAGAVREFCDLLVKLKNQK